jgi:hypothetical protein
MNLRWALDRGPANAAPAAPERPCCGGIHGSQRDLRGGRLELFCYRRVWTIAQRTSLGQNRAAR